METRRSSTTSGIYSALSSAAASTLQDTAPTTSVGQGSIGPRRTPTIVLPASRRVAAVAKPEEGRHPPLTEAGDKPIAPVSAEVAAEAGEKLIAPVLAGAANGGDNPTASVSGEKTQPPVSFELKSTDLIVTTKELGKGSYGAVFEGIWNSQPVAVKQISLFNEKIKKSCEEEEAILEEVTAKHVPYVVNFYGYIKFNTRYWFVMELMPQGTLDDMLKAQRLPKEKGVLNWGKCYEMIRCLVKAVDGLHKAGIGHGDFKPANILVAADGTVKLADFGFAKKFDGKVVNRGSPKWLSPEFLTNFILTEAVDVWALSIVMWQIAAEDSEPFKQFQYNHELPAFFNFISSGGRNPIPASCPPKMVDLITFGLHGNPKKRPTAGDLDTELQNGLDVAVSADLRLKCS